jgi:hypothetical protein
VAEALRGLSLNREWKGIWLLEAGVEPKVCGIEKGHGYVHLGLALPREHPAGEEKTLLGSDKLQSCVCVTEPEAELRQQCQAHKEDYQLGSFD